jgi:hypothetical protein
MLMPIPPGKMLVLYIRMTLRIGCERFRLQFVNEDSYDWYEAYFGEDDREWNCIPPSSADVQAFPKALSSHESWRKRTWVTMTQFWRRYTSGRLVGEFDLNVGGNEYTVRVNYYVQWQNGVVNELLLNLDNALQLQEIVEADFPPDDGFDGFDA